MLWAFKDAKTRFAQSRSTMACAKESRTAGSYIKMPTDACMKPAVFLSALFECFVLVGRIWGGRAY